MVRNLSYSHELRYRLIVGHKDVGEQNLHYQMLKRITSFPCGNDFQVKYIAIIAIYFL
jgi:hypothetical protein